MLIPNLVFFLRKKEMRKNEKVLKLPVRETRKTVSNVL